AGECEPADRDGPHVYRAHRHRRDACTAAAGPDGMGRRAACRDAGGFEERGAMTGRFRLARVAMAAVAVLAAIAVGWQVLFSNEASDSADVVELLRGTFTDVVEIRGQIEPVRSTYVTAPFNAGELQVVNIVRSGDVVEAGDVVVEFDAVTLRRTMQEKQGELRSARAELEQHDAQSRIGLEERRAAVAKAEFDVERAYLALGEI